MEHKINVHRIVRQKKGDNQYIKRHTHPFFHYIYILNGVGTIVVKDYAYEVQKHDFIMVSPKTEHEVYGKKGLITMDIKFDCDKELEKELAELPFFNECLSLSKVSVLKEIFEEAIMQKPRYMEFVNLKVLELLYLLIRDNAYSQNEDKQAYLNMNSGKVYQLKNVLSYIEANIQKPINVTELADIIGFSPSYFSTFFKELTGTPPVKYINKRKCEQAREMMLYTNFNITEIAELLGYESVHYFSRIFKKTMGLCPSRYMNQNFLDVVIHVDKKEKQMDGYEISIRNIKDDSIEVIKPLKF